MKDYVKQTGTKKSNNHSGAVKPQLKYWLIAATVLLLSALWGAVSLIHARHRQQQKQRSAAANTKKSSRRHQRRTQLAMNHSQTTTQDFDFYHLLPTMSVNVPETQQTANPSTDPQYQYQLQIASSKNQQAALALQRRLATIPLNTTIKKTITAQQNTWYKIMAGPFDDVVVAQSLQNQLRLKGFDALLIRQQQVTTQAAATKSAAPNPDPRAQLSSPRPASSKASTPSSSTKTMSRLMQLPQPQTAAQQDNSHITQ